MKGSNAITSKQLALFTFIAQTGIGITTLPSALAKEVGHDGWISVILTGFAALLLGAFIGLLVRRYGGKSILDINRLLFGKIAGTLPNILLLIYLVFASGLGVSLIGIFLKITLLPETPPLILTFFLLAPSAYIVRHGLKTSVRFKYLTTIPYFLLMIYLAVIYKEIRWTFLMPVGEAGALPILSSMKTSFFAYIGIELIAFVYPSVTDKDQALKWHAVATLLSIVFFTLVTLVCTAVFGERLLAIQSIPIFNLTRVYNAPILERVDLYFLGLWIVAMDCSVRAYINTSYYALQQTFGLKPGKWLLLALYGAIIAVTRIPKGINEVAGLFDIFNCFGIGVVFYMVLCLILSLFIRKGVKGS